MGEIKGTIHTTGFRYMDGDEFKDTVNKAMTDLGINFEEEMTSLRTYLDTQVTDMNQEMSAALDSIKNVSNVFKHMGDVNVNGQTSKFYQCGNLVIAEIHAQGTGGKVYIPYPDSIPLPLNSEAIRFNLSDVFNSSRDEKIIGFTVEKGSRTISSVQTLTGIASGVITFLVESTQPAFEPVVTVVTELPTEDIKSDTMYFLKKSDGTFEQYMYVENSWVKIGGDYSDGNGVSY